MRWLEHGERLCGASTSFEVDIERGSNHLILKAIQGETTVRTLYCVFWSRDESTCDEHPFAFKALKL